MVSIVGGASMTGATGGTAVTPRPRLLKAAHEFEAQMMKELLGSLSPSEGLTGDDDSGSGSGDALGAFAKEALGRALSEHGGLGIADAIVHSLSRRSQVASVKTSKG